MSLPDTVFIFVLALIIFGPKKLPEIGRQLGRLVAEFRRASDEFKYQIEEELRQVETAQKDKDPTEAPSLDESTEEVDSFAFESSTESEPVEDFESTLPVGQYPNIDALESTGFQASDGSESTYTESTYIDSLTEDGSNGALVTTAGENDSQSNDWETRAWEKESEVYESVPAHGARTLSTEAEPVSAANGAEETFAYAEASGAEGVVIPFEKPAARQPSVNGSNPAEADPTAHRRPVPVDPEIAHG